jgi:hypothetical protein
MRIPGKIDHDEGLLSLDFIIGFTIFMIAFIFVAIMISGLLVHLQSRTIDYDAVAYRTSVVLVEDAGEPKEWHLKNFTIAAERDSVKRLGLAVEKNYPDILNINKVNKFFNSSTPELGCYGQDKFCNPVDYRQRLIFGDYPYRFNISLKTLGPTYFPPKFVGDPIPVHQSVGFIKRIVKIKFSNASFNISLTPQSDLKYNRTLIRIDFSELYSRPPPYRIDPLNENLMININGFNGGLNITKAEICTYPLVGIPGCVGEDAYENNPRMNIFVDGNLTGNSNFPKEVMHNVTVFIDDGYFQRVGFDRFNAVDTRLTFDGNVTNQSLFLYNYSTVNSSPWLEPAVIEVRVW